MLKMPRTSLETRRRILLLKNEYTVDEIHKRLKEEHIYVSKVAIYGLLKKYRQYRVYTDLPKSKPQTKLNEEQVRFIDDEMSSNDELTARQMHALILERWPHLVVSLTTIKKTKNKLGWIATRPKYCQLVREAANK